MNKFAILAASIAVAACAGRGGSSSSGVQTPKAEPFPMVKVPGVYTETGQILSYSAIHFWDAFTDTSRHFVCDSSLVSGVPREEVEKQVGTFVSLLNMLPLDEARKALSTAYDRFEAVEKADTSSNVFEALTGLVSKYLYDPNSPARNEDIYLPFVEKLSVSPFTTALHASYAFDARMCSLNQAGTKAADFSFRTLEGKKMRLYSIKAPYTLLFFSNPGCPSCKEIMDNLMADSRIAGLIASGGIAVANIYIDSDLDEWRSYAVNYPKTWYNGYNDDFTIRMDLDYNVRAIPSLYILAEDKTVLMKDAPEDRAMEFLMTL